ncbi:MAG: hypothetical protein ACREGB_02410 [Candidatus Saccharimonadales bacterium]
MASFEHSISPEEQLHEDLLGYAGSLLIPGVSQQGPLCHLTSEEMVVANVVLSQTGLESAYAIAVGWTDSEGEPARRLGDDVVPHVIVGLPQMTLAYTLARRTASGAMYLRRDVLPRPEEMLEPYSGDPMPTRAETTNKQQFMQLIEQGGV